MFLRTSTSSAPVKSALSLEPTKCLTRHPAIPPSRHPANSRLSPLVEPDRCPCGDLFQITPEELLDGEDIARCPSCSLYVVVVYELDDIPNYLAKLEVYGS